uniref:3-hydroxyacyl-CoA dehydrogenase C-terminal domain-containing protein n=1 Tax=Parascaris equorum TaxID=6256 RepID=A0A914RZG3_PAREQ
MVCWPDRPFSPTGMVRDETSAQIGGRVMLQVSAQAKINVTLVDQSDEILKKGYAGIDKNLRRMYKKKFAEDKQKTPPIDNMANKRLELFLFYYKNCKEYLPKCIRLMISRYHQAETHLLLLKHDFVGPLFHTILATNTSSLRLSDVASKLKRKDKFGGLHFFNPVPVMKLLEVIRSKDTSDETFDSLLQFGKAIGKETVRCKAIRLIERDDAKLADIDTAMKLGAGYPMGPFELADYVGLDTCKFIVDGLYLDSFRLQISNRTS